MCAEGREELRQRLFEHALIVSTGPEQHPGQRLALAEYGIASGVGADGGGELSPVPDRAEEGHRARKRCDLSREGGSHSAASPSLCVRAARAAARTSAFESETRIVSVARSSCPDRTARSRA